MHCIIAGGTGFIGQALIKHWLAQNVQITVIGRNQHKIKKLFNTTVTALTWDKFKADSSNILSNADIIVNLTGANIGAKRWSEKRRKEILSSRIESTQLIANACAQLKEQSPRLLNASAIGIYGLQKQTPFNLPTPFDENSPTDFEPTDFLSEIGQQWEAATQIAKDNQVNVVNMRFGVVLDRHGGALKKMALPFYFGLGGKVGSGQQPFSWISLSDLISAIDFIVQHPEVTGPINLVAMKAVFQEELARSLAKVLKRPCWFTMPAFLLKLVFGKMAEELLLEGQHVVPMRLTNLGFQFKHPDIDTALRDIYQRG